MHHRAVNIAGQTFGYLTAIAYAGSDGKKSLWRAQCVCGNERTYAATELRKGKLRSCGCRTGELIAASRRTHGMSKHPAYAVWSSMVDRCRLPTHQAWHNYGARGICVCARWQEGFENFWADMGPTYQQGLTLERRNNEGNYEPDNCYWATWTAQNRNKRNSVRLDGIPVVEIAEQQGLSRSTAYFRHQRGRLTLSTAAPDIASSSGHKAAGDI